SIIWTSSNKLTGSLTSAPKAAKAAAASSRKARPNSSPATKSPTPATPSPAFCTSTTATPTTSTSSSAAVEPQSSLLYVPLRHAEERSDEESLFLSGLSYNLVTDRHQRFVMPWAPFSISSSNILPTPAGFSSACASPPTNPRPLFLPPL